MPFLEELGKARNLWNKFLETQKLPEISFQDFIGDGFKICPQDSLKIIGFFKGAEVEIKDNSIIFWNKDKTSFFKWYQENLTKV